MADKLEGLKKKIVAYKEQLTKLGSDAKKALEARVVRKKLKRVQRRLRKSIPLSLDDKLKQATKFQETIGKLLSDLTKGKKKVDADPFVHSLRKKTKSLNKRVKALNRKIEKRKAAEAPAAPAAPAEVKS
jgi:chromosome segregation ATPase